MSEANYFLLYFKVLSYFSIIILFVSLPVNLLDCWVLNICRNSLYVKEIMLC